MSVIFRGKEPLDTYSGLGNSLNSPQRLLTLSWLHRPRKACAQASCPTQAEDQRRHGRCSLKHRAALRER